MTKQEIGSILMRLRERAGKSREEVADLLGKSVKTVGHWETGYAQPDANTLFLLCTIYGADLNESFGFPANSKKAPPISDEAMKLAKDYDDLDHWGQKQVRSVADNEAARVADERRRAIREEVEEPEDNVVYISLRCSIQSASAGTGTYLGPEAFETIHVRDNELTRRASFGVPVSGDSMEPTYHDGDILMVEGADEIEVGEIGIFTIDGEGYVKELGAGELISLNPRYDPIPIGDSIRCHGRVIGILDTAWIEK